MFLEYLPKSKQKRVMTGMLLFTKTLTRDMRKKSMYRSIMKSLVNLLPVSPFCFAFPFGTAARMAEKKKTSNMIYVE